MVGLARDTGNRTGAGGGGKGACAGALCRAIVRHPLDPAAPAADASTVRKLFMMKLRLIVAALAMAACAPAPPPGPVVQNDPCADSAYLALRDAHPDSLSEREFQLLRDRERSCAAVRALLGAVAASESSPVLPPNPIYTWTEATHGHAGQVIKVRNEADVALTITSLELFECRNIRGSCGVKRLNVTLQPGREQIVMRVHFRQGVADSHYRYRFQYTLARDP